MAGLGSHCRSRQSHLIRITFLKRHRESAPVNLTEPSWRLGRAHGAGICSLTGAPISHGQSVYKPRRDAKKPTLNQDAMILSEMVLVQIEAVNGLESSDYNELMTDDE
jgi:hypothetical protein